MAILVAGETPQPRYTRQRRGYEPDPKGAATALVRRAIINISVRRPNYARVEAMLADINALPPERLTPGESRTGGVGARPDAGRPPRDAGGGPAFACLGAGRQNVARSSAPRLDRDLATARLGQRDDAGRLRRGAKAPFAAWADGFDRPTAVLLNPDFEPLAVDPELTASSRRNGRAAE